VYAMMVGALSGILMFEVEDLTYLTFRCSHLIHLLV